MFSTTTAVETSGDKTRHPPGLERLKGNANIVESRRKFFLSSPVPELGFSGKWKTKIYEREVACQSFDEASSASLVNSSKFSHFTDDLLISRLDFVRKVAMDEFQSASDYSCNINLGLKVAGRFPRNEINFENSPL